MKTQYRKWIAKKLRQLRGEWTQQFVADQLEIKLRTYQAYEEARAEPGLRLLKKICILFSISLDEFTVDSPA